MPGRSGLGLLEPLREGEDPWVTAGGIDRKSLMNALLASGQAHSLDFLFSGSLKGPSGTVAGSGRRNPGLSPTLAPEPDRGPQTESPAL